MGTAIDRASARTDLFHRGTAYGIPGEQVDCMNVLAVHEAGLAAAEHAREHAVHERGRQRVARPVLRRGQQADDEVSLAAPGQTEVHRAGEAGGAGLAVQVGAEQLIDLQRAVLRRLPGSRRRPAPAAGRTVAARPSG